MQIDINSFRLKILPEDKEAVKAYVSKIKEASLCRYKWRRLASERNELWVIGEQKLGLDRKTMEIADKWEDDKIPHVQHNYLRYIPEIVSARLLKDRPSITAYPTTEEARDANAAEITSRFIEHLELELGFDEQLHDIVRLGIQHGTAGFKFGFDPDTDKLFLEPCTIFDTIIDPTAKRYEDSKWVAFVDYKTEEEAREYFSEDEQDSLALEITDYKPSIDADEAKGVECLELWHLPTAKVPAGLYVKLIGGNVVHTQDYPYFVEPRENPETGQKVAILPFAMFRVHQRRGSALGDTWLDDAIEIQAQINETESGLQNLERKTSSVKLICSNDQTLEAIRSGKSQYLKIAPNEDIHWLAQPQIPQLILANRDFKVQKLFDICGINTLTGGYENPKSGASARQIAYMYELDSEKHAGTSKSIERMIERTFRSLISLAQEMYAVPRMMRITGKSDFEVRNFSGADIAGVDVRLEPRAGAERYAATKGEDIYNTYSQSDPELAIEGKATGLGEKLSDTYAKKLLQFEVETFLQGAMPSLDVEPATAIAYLQRMIGLMQESGDQRAPMLMQLLAAYQQREQELMQQQQMPEQPVQ